MRSKSNPFPAMVHGFPQRDALSLRTCGTILKHLCCDKKKKDKERAGVWKDGMGRGNEGGELNANADNETLALEEK